MRTFDWVQHKKHRDYVIETEGQWAGLLDENGIPLIDLPGFIDMKSTIQRLSPGDFQAEILVDTGYDVPHNAVRELIADDLGKVDGYGQLVPSDSSTRLLAIEREGMRTVHTIAYSEAKGEVHHPDSLIIHGVDLLDLLDALPAPSDLKSWREAVFHNLDRDWVQEFEKPRDLAEIKLGEVADGYSEEGPAEATIRKIITDSINAVNTAYGWTDQPHIVVDQTSTGLPSPDVLIRLTDISVLETVASYALNAGVGITVSMWFPGDEPVNGKTYTHPIAVVKVEQMEIND